MISRFRSTRIVATSLALLCGFVGMTRPALAQSPADWRADLGYMMGAIKSVHPSPFHRVSESAFDSAAARLSRDLERLTPQQVAVRMQGIVALLNDGHSRVELGAPVFQRKKFFGVRIDRFADGIFITSTSPAMAKLAGLRVARIGGLSAEVAWDSVMKLSSGDNAFSRMSGVPLMLTMPEVLSGTGLSSRDSLRLTVSEQGRNRDVDVAAEEGAFRPQWSTSALPKESPAGAQSRGVTVPLSEMHRSESYWFTQAGSIVYAQINQVASSRDTVDLGPVRGVITLPSFGARVVAFADSVHASKLVIDLRYNGGGNNFLGRPLVKAIIEHPQVNQRGRLFVVTGRETYSAAMNLVSMLEDRTAAIFVGEPPGGTPAHYGDATRFTMPRSKLNFFISTLHWDTGVQPTDVRETMEPQLPAPPRFADLVRNTDAAFDKITKYQEGDVLSDRLLATYKSSGLDSALASYDAGRRTLSASDPWRSDIQQILEFAGDVISAAKNREDIFRAFSAVTDRYPASYEAWVERGRVHGFVGDWPDVLMSLAKARELRPQNDFIRRSYEAAKLR
jgi:hypothetical protein